LTRTAAGMALSMSNPPEPRSVHEEVFDEVMDTEETPHPNRREHGKQNPRPDDEDLARRTDIERSEVGLPEQEHDQP
jgi:hypothetical protein